MLEQLKREVYEANMLLPRYGLITFTWGNVSGIDREHGLVVIKPSGVEYDELTPEKMVVVDLNGKKAEDGLNPSSDTPTHVALYNAFPGIGGVVHTHSTWATAVAQAGTALPAHGTTHADYFHGAVAVTRDMTVAEITGQYELETGNVIIETCRESYERIPAVLVRNHGPFTWGPTPQKAVENSVVLEEVARMAGHARLFNPALSAMPQPLLDKHYLRKHGPGAYYGQR